MVRATGLRLAITDVAIGRFLVATMAAGFAALLIAGGAAVWVTSRNQEHTAWVNHTYEVEVALGRARTLIEQAETARRGYMLMPRQSLFMDNYTSADSELTPVIARIAWLTRDNPRQRARIAELRPLLAGVRAQRELTNALVRQGRADAAMALFRTTIVSATAAPMTRIRRLIADMDGEERALLAIRDADQQASVRAFYVALTVGGVLLLLVALVSLLTILRYTRDLTTSRDKLRDLNENLEGAVRERTADLSRANEEIQRFAYIVSHDLRSPLVNVMGFTAELDTATHALRELVDRAEAQAPAMLTEEARLAAREDLPEAIGFIRTSTAKMDRLINAILRLSREGRRVISPETLDMTLLVGGIRDTVQKRLTDGGTRLTVRALPAIVSDRVAIEQIFSNLIENAVKYLQPGRPGAIEVRGREEGTRALFDVVDNGRGIDPRDHQRVFDLFRRSGQQDQPGEGIGLAHVRALAYRLGGIIDVQSELGAGATFRLSLPLRYEPQETP